MLKNLCRLSLLILLCFLLVYAPEIFSGIGAPYSLAAPQRILLRIALCSASAPDSLAAALNAYQKQHPHVHLRITRLSEEQLLNMAQPYPDVILYTAASAPMLPEGFAAAQASQTSLHAATRDSQGSQTAEEFAAYIDEAIAAQSGSL